MHLSLHQIAQALQLQGRVVGTNPLITGARIDSRDVCPGDLFFCLAGERTDGHDHAAQAVANGAAAVVAARVLPELNGRVPVLVVQESMTVQDALGKIASLWREGFGGRVIGVTGSAGKTTVKEMLARVCLRAGSTCWNRLNWNNQIGLPLSVSACPGNEQFWVMEAGISRPGDMDDLGAILRPDLAVLLNAGPAHLADLGDVACVAAAKARLVRYLSMDGAALVNRDCSELWQESRAYTERLHAFSMVDSDAEFFCGEPVQAGPDRMTLELRLRDCAMQLSWPTEQAPVPQNVLAVAAAATLLGIDAEAIRSELSAGISLPGRFSVEHIGTWVLVDDTYNANPLSMHVALHRARSLAGGRRLVCVLGDMLELGTAAGAEHEQLGRTLAGVCTGVIYHGQHADDVRAGLAAEHGAAWFEECLVLDQFVESWRAVVQGDGLGCKTDEQAGYVDGGVVLFKGSRAGKMETFLQALRTELHA